MGPRTSCRSAGTCLFVMAIAIAICIALPLSCFADEPNPPKLEQPLRPRPREAAYLNAVVAAGNTEKKLAAAAKLATLRDQDVAASLVWSLNDVESEVRAAVAEALGSCGNRGTVPWLILSLRDSDPKVAHAAHASLERLTGRIDDFSAVDGPQTQRAGHQRWSAWFCRTDWDTIENDLISQISTVDLLVARKAIEALSHVAGERGRAALRDLVETDAAADESFRLAALRALGDLRDKDAVPQLRQILDQALGAFTTRGGQNHKLDSDNALVQLVSVVLEALDRIGNDDAEELLRAADQLVRSHCKLVSSDEPHAESAAALVHRRIEAALRNIEVRGRQP